MVVGAFLGKVFGRSLKEDFKLFRNLVLVGKCKLKFEMGTCRKPVGKLSNRSNWGTNILWMKCCGILGSKSMTTKGPATDLITSPDS